MRFISDWHESIFKRHSRRKFNGRELTIEDLVRLNNFCKEYRPFSGGQAHLVASSVEDVFKGTLGT